MLWGIVIGVGMVVCCHIYLWLHPDSRTKEEKRLDEWYEPW